ncbi:MAG: putative WbfO protein [Gemmatimonadetes bacterium]|nr:putative WbfO protein [Gemmatimonadota bacterium]
MTGTSGRPPRVSVLMSAFNAESSIARAVESIRAQEFEDWELLIVDDGSTDTTGAILHAIARTDARVHVLVHERNLGLPTSLNHALSLVRGDLVARMDGDDVALADRFRRQVEFLDVHPEIDVLGGGALEVTHDGRPLGELRRAEHHEQLIARIFTENPFIHPTIMARRTVFERLGGYDVTCRRGQDYELWLRAYRMFRFHNLPRPLIHYARRDRSRWRDARHSSRIVLRALQRENRLWPDGWLAARPLAATTWERIRGTFAGSRRGA